MSRSKSFAALDRTKSPILLPAAHDALSARLIENAGFSGLSVAGSSLLAARYALPDLGLVGLSDMSAGVRDILMATELPCLVDGDNGYGDVKAVVRMVDVYESLGAAAVVIEDQEAVVKRPGQEAALSVCSEDAIVAKLGAAVQARRSNDFWIIGRTDAYGVSGIDATLRRCDAYLKAGVDGLFVAGVRTEEDLRRVGETFGGVPLIAVMYGTPGWPALSPSELHAIGFGLIIYPHALVAAACLAMRATLADLSGHGAQGDADAFQIEPEARDVMNAATRLVDWQSLPHSAATAAR